MRRFTTAGLVACLTVALCAATVRAAGDKPAKPHPKPIAWADAEGKPTIDEGHTVGFYLWHEGDTVYVVSADESSKGHKYAGRITVVGGTIESPTGISEEKKDGFKQEKPNVLTFSFDTHKATDGLKFTLKMDATTTAAGDKPAAKAHKPHIAFVLHRNKHQTAKIFYGAKATQAESDPVVFALGAAAN